MRHIASCSLPALRYFSTLPHERHDFRKNKNHWIQIVCFDFLYKFCLKHLSFWEEFSETWWKMYIGLHVKYRYYCQILMILEFSRHIFLGKKKNTSIFMEIGSVGTELFHAHGRRDRYDETSRNFANVPKKCDFWLPPRGTWEMLSLSLSLSLSLWNSAATYRLRNQEYPWRLVIPKRRLGITTTGHVLAQTKAVLVPTKCYICATFDQQNQCTSLVQLNCQYVSFSQNRFTFAGVETSEFSDGRSARGFYTQANS
jgi:hypothetical protein